MSKPFGRVITAMVTPFDQRQDVDYNVARALAQRLVDAGSDGLVICGTTGESPTLSDEEKVKLSATIAEAVGDRAFIWAGTGSYDTAKTIALSKEAIAAGADGLLLVTPYYNKPPQSNLIAHFERIADEVDAPIMLYNIPGRTAVNMVPETVAALAEHPRIVAIKQANPSLAETARIRMLCPDDFLIYSGEDNITLPMLSVGACGVVSVASHLVAAELAEMIDAFRSGDVARAQQLHLRLLPLFDVLFTVTNPIPLKAALEMIGIPVGSPRPPLAAADESVRQRIKEVMAELQLVATEQHA